MTVWYSTDLGWKSGTDVSSKFSSFLSDRFSSGDTLVLEDTYRLTGSNLRVPEGVTLTAVEGAGFDIVTSASDRSGLLVLSDGVSVDNVTFTAVSAPRTGYSATNPEVGEDYHGKRVLVVDGDGVTIKNSAFKGNVAMHVDVQGGDDLTIRDSLFEGGFYQVRLTGSADDAQIVGSHFRKSLGDGIKTESFDGQGPQRALVRDTLFESNARDGIDTAGGFRDGRVENVVFYDNGVSGIDIKSIYKDVSDLNPRKANVGITVTDSQFIDSPNGVVVTVLNRGTVLTTSNQDIIPHDIRVTDSVFENIGAGDTRAFLVKDGYDITWDGLTFRGNVTALRFMDADTPGTLSGKNVGGVVESRTAPLDQSVDQIWPRDAGPVAGEGAIQGDGGPPTPPPEPAPKPEPEPIMVDSVPTPKDEKPPAPAPKPADDGTVLLRLDGEAKFDGSNNSVIETAPDESFQIEAATVSFDFKASTVSGFQGLVSKDAYGAAADDSHFTSYLQNGTLHVRFQEGADTKAFDVSEIRAGTEYSVRVGFGDGEIALWLDDKLVGRESFDYSWTGNTEYLQIGANGWASQAGESGFQHVFNGTISDLSIVADSHADAESDLTSQPILFEMGGDMEFDGSAKSVIELKPQDALKVDEAAISFTFNTDTLSGRQGLISKDAYGADADDGHFTSYVQNEALYVRFQNDDVSKTFIASGIKANTDYVVTASFDEDEVAVWMNGEGLGAQALDMSWAGNEEYLQIGANGWASRPGAAGHTDRFDGTISDVSIVGVGPSGAAEIHAAIMADDFIF